MKTIVRRYVADRRPWAVCYLDRVGDKAIMKRWSFVALSQTHHNGGWFSRREKEDHSGILRHDMRICETGPQHGHVKRTHGPSHVQHLATIHNDNDFPNVTKDMLLHHSI